MRYAAITALMTAITVSTVALADGSAQKLTVDEQEFIRIYEQQNAGAKESSDLGKLAQQLSKAENSSDPAKKLNLLDSALQKAMRAQTESSDTASYSNVTNYIQKAKTALSEGNVERSARMINRAQGDAARMQRRAEIKARIASLRNCNG